MKVQTLTCIECPLGCTMTVTTDGERISVVGNGCLRGKAYAENEVTCPRRVITSTIRATNGKMLPVKTDKPVKKSEIFEIMQKINATTCTAPIKIGDVIVENITEDIALIATGNLQ